jgi:hypothetical protein
MMPVSVYASLAANPSSFRDKDDGNSWLKIKNRSYTQAEGRHELLNRR